MPAKYTLTPKGTHFFTLATPRLDEATAQVRATLTFEELDPSQTAQATKTLATLQASLSALYGEEVELYARQDTPDDIEISTAHDGEKLDLSQTPIVLATPKAAETPAIITARQAQQAYKTLRKEWPTLRRFMPLYIDPTPNPKEVTPKEFALKIADIVAGAVNEERDRQEERGEI